MTQIVGGDFESKMLIDGQPVHGEECTFTNFKPYIEVESVGWPASALRDGDER